MGFMMYSCTVIFSIILENLNKCKCVKKLADEGYKFDDYKMFNLSSIVNFMPFINIFTSLRNLIIYRRIKNYSSEQLIKLNNIIPFTYEEKELYRKNACMGNALKLNINNYAKPNMILLYNEKNEENIIYFTVENKQKIIISTKGPVSKLNKQKQYDILQKRLAAVDFNLENQKQNLKENNIQKNDTYRNLNIFNKNFDNQNFHENENTKVYVKKLIK